MTLSEPKIDIWVTHHHDDFKSPIRLFKLSTLQTREKKNWKQSENSCVFCPHIKMYSVKLAKIPPILPKFCHPKIYCMQLTLYCLWKTQFFILNTSFCGNLKGLVELANVTVTIIFITFLWLYIQLFLSFVS